MSEAAPTEDLADLYDNAPCGYLSLSSSGRIVKANRTLAGWIGRSEEELLGQPFHAILGFGGRIAFETHIAPMLRLKGQVHEIALDLVDADGEKIPTIANASERRGEDGGHVFTRITLFRAIERRLFERSLIEARAKAEKDSRAEQDAGELRDQFIAVLGHDLRNPLAALAAGINMLGRSQHGDDRTADILEKMQSSVTRASDLIDDVLDFARGRLGSGMQVDIEQTGSLDTVIAQTVGEMRLISPESTFDVVLAIDAPVHCDSDRIAQLTSNLLANAVTHGAADQPVMVRARTSSGEFVLSIANGGERISDEVRQSLFKPFFRGEARKSRQGLGLGLFIVNEIARAHGGRMDVESTDDESRFTFTMPLNAKASEPEIEKPDEAELKD